MFRADCRTRSDIAVILCTRNGVTRGFIDQAIESIFAQTLPPDELIVVDDGSTDGTLVELRRRYAHVNILQNQGRGLAAARNTGIRAARSAWIALIDDDDVWNSEKLALQSAQIASSQNAKNHIWASRSAYFQDGSTRLKQYRLLLHLAVWPACLLGGPAIPSGVLISQELFRKIGLFNEEISVGSFYEFLIRSLAANSTLSFSERVLLYHRCHPRQMTSALPRSDDTVYVFDRIVLDYLRALSPEIGERIRCSRAAITFRRILLQAGIRGSIRYWSSTPLRPIRCNRRSLVFFLLDTVATRTPRWLSQFIRKVAVGILLPAKAVLNAGAPDSWEIDRPSD